MFGVEGERRVLLKRGDRCLEDCASRWRNCVFEAFKGRGFFIPQFEMIARSEVNRSSTTSRQ